MDIIEEFEVQDPKGYNIIGVGGIETTTGIDEKTYEFITVELEERGDDEYETVGKIIKKTFFPESVLYKKLKPIAEKPKEERVNLMKDLKPLRLRKLAAEVRPYYVSHRNSEGKIVKDVYHKNHINKGLPIMADTVTIYLLDGESARQELKAWRQRTAAAGMFVVFEQVEKLKKEYSSEESLALLHRVPNLKAKETNSAAATEESAEAEE